VRAGASTAEALTTWGLTPLLSRPLSLAKLQNLYADQLDETPRSLVR